MTPNPEHNVDPYKGERRISILIADFFLLIYLKVSYSVNMYSTVTKAVKLFAHEWVRKNIFFPSKKSQHRILFSKSEALHEAEPGNK
jgi:hypothetical protein